MRRRDGTARVLNIERRWGGKSWRGGWRETDLLLVRNGDRGRIPDAAHGGLAIDRAAGAIPVAGRVEQNRRVHERALSK